MSGTKAESKDKTAVVQSISTVKVNYAELITSLKVLTASTVIVYVPASAYVA